MWRKISRRLLYNRKKVVFLVKIGNIILMNLQEIGRNIEIRRNALNLKQEDLAEMTGVTAKTLYHVETGKGNPSLENLQRILEALGLELYIGLKKIDIP